MDNRRLVFRKIDTLLPSILLFVFVVCSSFLNGTLLCILSFLFCLLLFFSHIKKPCLYSKFLYLAYPLLCCFLIGAFSALFNGGIDFHSEARASFYLLQNLLFIAFGFLLGVSETKARITKSLFLGSLFICLVHFIKLVILFASGSSVSFVGFRTIFIYGDISVIISLFLMLTDFANFGKFSTKRKIIFIFCFLLLLSNVILEFSRANLVLELTLFAGYFFSIFPFKKALIVVGGSLFALLAVLLLCYFLNVPFISGFAQKLFYSFNELSPNTDWSVENNRTANWRGYEIFSGLVDIKNSSLFTFLFGKGLGHSIPLPFPSAIASNFYSSLPVIHNSYVELFCSTGFVGFCFILLFFFHLFVLCFENINIFSRVICFSLILFFVVVSYTTMGIFSSAGFSSLTLLISFFLFSDFHGFTFASFWGCFYEKA